MINFTDNSHSQNGLRYLEPLAMGGIDNDHKIIIFIHHMPMALVNLCHYAAHPLQQVFPA